MRNILYSELIDNIEDRLNHFVGKSLTESDRQLLIAPQRIAYAVTKALYEFVLYAEKSIISDLVISEILTETFSDNNVNSYKFPNELFVFRKDKGIISIILDNEQMPINMGALKEEIDYFANSAMFGPRFHAFSIDEYASYFYAPSKVQFTLEFIRLPDAVRSANQNDYKGVQVKITAAPTASGNITLSDGTNSLTIALSNGDTINGTAQKITDAVNAATTFFYDAFLSNDTITLAHRFDNSLNTILNPSFVDTDTTGAVATITDIGTYRLPVELDWLDVLAEKALKYLISTEIVLNQDAKKANNNQQTAKN